MFKKRAVILSKFIVIFIVIILTGLSLMMEVDSIFLGCDPLEQYYVYGGSVMISTNTGTGESGKQACLNWCNSQSQEGKSCWWFAKDGGCVYASGERTPANRQDSNAQYFYASNCNYESCTTGMKNYYYDSDGDGYGVSSNYKYDCRPSGFYTASQGGDCNDNNKNVNPEVSEICDGLDNNCNNQIDEGLNFANFYYDGDEDNYGSADKIYSCTASGFYTASQNNDCNDNNHLINPGVAETCDSIDNNCDKLIDNLVGSCYTGPSGTENVGVCKGGPKTCNGRAITCFGEVLPQSENLKSETACTDNLDNDCDSFVDRNDGLADSQGLHCQEKLGNKDINDKGICINLKDDDSNGMTDLDDLGCKDLCVWPKYFITSNTWEDLTKQKRFCCGNQDDYEFSKSCVVGSGVVCDASLSCCDSNNDAEYNGVCYGDGSSSTRTVVNGIFTSYHDDLAVVAIKDQWWDCDSAPDKCETCGGKEAGGAKTLLDPKSKGGYLVCGGGSCWIKSGESTALGEYANKDKEACCGDDSGENFRTKTILYGPNAGKTYNACCSQQNACVDSTWTCRSGIEGWASGTCTDKIDNNCNGLIDCEDPECAFEKSASSGVVDPYCSTSPFCNSRLISGDLVDKTLLEDANGIIHQKDDKQWLFKAKAKGEACQKSGDSTIFGDLYRCSSGEGANDYDKTGDYVCKGLCDGLGKCSLAVDCTDCNLKGGGTGDKFDSSVSPYCGTIQDGKTAVMGSFLDYTCSGGPMQTSPESLCKLATEKPIDKPLDICNTPSEVCIKDKNNGNAFCRLVVLDFFRSIFKIWLK